MKEKSNVAARQRGESELPSWLESSDAEFLKIARKLVSARGKAERDRLLSEGLGGKFAARLLRDSERQVECWKFVGQLYADKAWRGLFRNTGATGAPPSPRSFPGPQVTAIVQTLLGLDGKHALAWCIHAYLTRTGKTAEGIAQAIIAGAFGEKVFIEAIGAALKELEAKPKLYPRGITGKIASLLSRSFSTRSTPGRGTSVAALVGSVTLTRVHAATLIQALLSAKLPEDTPPADNLPSALAETAWIEADDALARALQQTPALREAIRGSTELGPRIRSQLGAIIQAVRASAAKRELEIEGDPGSEAAFDPVKHAQDDPRVKAAERVRIVTPTVFQGRGANRRVLRVADVEPA
jgi:hypothetical protein